MAELHTALKTLGPIDWSEVPVDNLKPFLQQAFEDGELICNSVPHPPNGTEFQSAKPIHSTPDSATSAKDIVESDARPPPPHPTHAELQTSWGKPMKIAPKDNPLGISVYKMAGKDRHGAWFARRSVHEGISFTKFKKAMRREFPESLAVQGGPGEGNVRGIGGDKRLEKKMVEGVGQLEVLQLSAQFPGPTTPREFITLLLTSDSALTEKSIVENGGRKVNPRHFMVVSKPVKHPDAPERNGYIRGQYESVEMIREIPLHPEPSGEEEDQSTNKHELNPVEWIMITRSDPGGGIPRFMVERGTPSSICADAVKFLDWACGKDEIPEPDADEEQVSAAQTQHAQQVEAVPASTTVDGAHANTVVTQPSTQPQGPAAQGGIVSHLTNALEAGIEAYAPTSVASYAREYLHPEDESDTSDESSSDDTSSFASAPEIPEYKTHRQATASVDSIGVSVSSTPDSLALGGSSHHERELRKLEEKRQKADLQLLKKKEVEDEKLEAAKQKENADQAKAAEKHEREIRKIEEKHQKELAKIQAKKEKELRKAEQKRAKQLDRETVSRVSRERDDFRTQLDMVKKENSLLREQTGDLERENRLLVERLSKLGGPEAVASMKHDFESGRARSGSMKSLGKGQVH